MDQYSSRYRRDGPCSHCRSHLITTTVSYHQGGRKVGGRDKPCLGQLGPETGRTRSDQEMEEAFRASATIAGMFLIEAAINLIQWLTFIALPQAHRTRSPYPKIEGEPASPGRWAIGQGIERIGYASGAINLMSNAHAA
ncbi:uncharacterized protein CLUP02_15757 [Colletotrichum lupini]|uniref:Uncharacterized protein n=1 Tax=Colletotrichum lupini TaxID=145971 RepID=A0A9Q8T8L5_9PEZI|nr:uncharacterized protein CLUP02_15757 [Colletotrichum lupini]UQC90227.1 hypothetical protein CLUP02_15757 [Colletotrichum lupini]